MGTLDKLLNNLVLGERGYWYYDHAFTEYCHVSGGQFYRKADARNHLKGRMKELIRNESLLINYLQLHFAAIEATSP